MDSKFEMQSFSKFLKSTFYSWEKFRKLQSFGWIWILGTFFIFSQFIFLDVYKELAIFNSGWINYNSKLYSCSLHLPSFGEIQFPNFQKPRVIQCFKSQIWNFEIQKWKNLNFIFLPVTLTSSGTFFWHTLYVNWTW